MMIVCGMAKLSLIIELGYWWIQYLLLDSKRVLYAIEKTLRKTLQHTFVKIIPWLTVGRLCIVALRTTLCQV